MKLWKLVVLIVAISIMQPIYSGPSKRWKLRKISDTVKNRIGTGLAVFGVAKSLYTLFTGVKQIKQENEEAKETQKAMKAIQSTISEINTKVDHALKQQEATMNLLERLPEILQGLLLQSDMRKHLVDLNTMNDNYEYYSTNITNIDKKILVSYAKDVVSHGHNSPRFISAQMHTLLIPPQGILRSKGVLDHFAETLQDAPFWKLCHFKQSRQQIFYNYWGNVVFARLRAYTMKIFGYSILKLFGHGSYFETEVQILNDNFRDQIQREISLVERYLRELSREILICDPSVHVRGQTFVEVTKLQQGYIVNQLDLIGTCWAECYQGWSNTGHGCSNQLCSRQKTCRHVGSCVDPENYNLRVYVRRTGHDSRRYSYVAGNRVTYGNPAQVETTDDYIQVWTWTQDYWTKKWTGPWLWSKKIYTTQNCNYCFCLCYDDTKSDRYFSVRPAMANYTENHVVTGLRFVKHNRVIHLQIQAGKLLQNGYIDHTTVEWVPLHDKQWVDYVKIDSSRVINLDDVIAEKGNVVVGVRLITKGNGPLMLSLATAAFNFTKEVLTFEGDGPEWITSHLTAHRVNIDMRNRYISLRANSSSAPHKNPASTRFGPSGWREDVAQTTIPSLDAQPVVSLEPTPLQGAGLYWKGQKQLGGFIAPKIFIYDTLSNLTIDQPLDKT